MCSPTNRGIDLGVIEDSAVLEGVWIILTSFVLTTIKGDMMQVCVFSFMASQTGGGTDLGLIED